MSQGLFLFEGQMTVGPTDIPKSKLDEILATFGYVGAWQGTGVIGYKLQTPRPPFPIDLTLGGVLVGRDGTLWFRRARIVDLLDRLAGLGSQSDEELVIRAMRRLDS
jgi:hypothetical protein